MDIEVKAIIVQLIWNISNEAVSENVIHKHKINTSTKELLYSCILVNLELRIRFQ